MKKYNNELFAVSIPAIVAAVGGHLWLAGLIILGYLIYCIGKSIHKSSKTGNWQKATTAKQIRKKTLERIAIQNKYPISDRYNPNSKCWKELKSHKEKWAEPGTNAYKQINEREKAYD